MTDFRTLLALLGALAFAATAQAAVLRAEPEAQPPSAERPAKSQARATRSTLVQLPAPSAAEQVVRRGKPGVPDQVGVGRAVIELGNEAAALVRLQWETLADGAQVAALRIASPQAAALRIALRVKRLPPGTILRFHADGEAADATEVTAAEVLATLEANAAADGPGASAQDWWSPIVEGPVLAMEIEIPAGASTKDVKLHMPDVSHLVESIRDGFVAKVAGGCNVDASCQVANWGNQINATARMVFTVGANSFLCSGTLIADTVTDTTIPYFITANHCISTQTVASTLQTYWKYRSSSCNGAAGAFETRTGGATLLHASAGTDTAFLQLNNTPPAGTAYAGWLATALPASGAAVTGTHHPRGDLAKISFGAFTSHQTCTDSSNGNFSCAPASAAAGTFFEVRWTAGVTEGGSSGSALFLDNGKYLVGTLYGGASSCATPGEGDYYGRFDVVFNAALKTWLAPVTPPPPTPVFRALTVSVSGSGAVASTPAGIDCGPWCTAQIADGANVSLTATPATGSYFSLWSGDCSGTSPCNLSMTGPRAVTAVFLPLPSSGTDFTADGRPDLLWRNTASGATWLWTMNGLQRASDRLLAAVDPGWELAGTGDFNQDGYLDVVWRNAANGAAYVWYFNNGTYQSDAALFQVDPVWKIAAIADFNLDGRPDLLMRHATTGSAFLWYFNGVTGVASQHLFGIDPVWKVEGVGDFNRDGRVDLLFRHATSGLAFVWNTYSDGANTGLGASNPALFAIDPVWEVAQVADWDADGDLDLVFRNRNTGVVFIWYLDGLALAQSAYLTQIDPGWAIVPRR